MALGASSGLQGWLLPEDPFVETYLVRPGGATVFALAADERMTVVDRFGGQTAEVTVLDERGEDDAAAVGAQADAPATVVRNAYRDRNGSLLVRELASRGLDPTEAKALRLFDADSLPGSSQAFRADRAVTVVVAAPAGRIVDGDPPPSDLLVEVRRTTPRA
jgi:aminomethyltransferase